MDNRNVYTIEGKDIPFRLREIPQPPKKLYVKGTLPKPEMKVLCMVGSRKHSSYGEEATKKLISGLIGYNICIVSGLALGIDGIVHKAALDAGLHTIAFPGSGLDKKVLYPFKHQKLADEIVQSGGALISEYEMTHPSFEWTFPQRNRLMAGISEATIIVEAREKSGTLITSRMALDYNRNVGAVPGNITSDLSFGSNELLRLGAVPITSSADVLEILGFNRPDTDDGKRVFQKDLMLNLNEKERKIIECLQIEPLTHEQLVLKSGFSAKEINSIISSLELQGFLRWSSRGFILL